MLTGELATFIDTADSGNAVYRRFCKDCGSPVLTDTDKAREEGAIFFKAGTLDETADIEPSIHMWTKSAQSWFAFPCGQTQLPEQ